MSGLSSRPQKSRLASRSVFKNPLSLLGVASLVVLFALQPVTAGAASKLTGAASKMTAPPQVTIALVGGDVTSLALWMIAAGPLYFGKIDKEFHTQIIQNSVGSRAVGIPLFTSGQDQFISVGSSYPILSATDGVDALGVMNAFTGTGAVLVGAAKYKSSRGSNVAAYNGAHWCFSSATGADGLTDIAAATAAGLTWSSQPTVNIGAVAAYLPTLQSGQCDITSMDTTSAANAVLQGIGYVVENPGELSLQPKLFGGIIIGSQMITSNRFAKSYPALTQAIVTEMVKALLFLQANAKNAEKIYAHTPNNFKQSTAIGSFVQQWELTAPTYTSTSGLATLSAVKTTANFYRSAGTLTVPYTPPAGFTNKYVYQAYKDLGLSRPPSSGAAERS